MSDIHRKEIFSMNEYDEFNTSITSPVVSHPSKHQDRDAHTHREVQYTNVKRNRSESEEDSLSSSYEESNPYLDSEVFIEMNIIQLKRDLLYVSNNSSTLSNNMYIV